MKDNKSKGNKILTSKSAVIFGAALAALTGNKAVAVEDTSSYSENLGKNSIEVSASKKVKPMPVLKLNLNNPDESKFIASHTSHRSHSSHRSHYSHRSGAMFS